MQHGFRHTRNQRWRLREWARSRPSAELGNKQTEETSTMRNGIFHLVTGNDGRLCAVGSGGLRAKEIRYRRDRYRNQGRADRAVFCSHITSDANIGKTQAAYMKMINDQGGINGRKINLIEYDDADIAAEDGRTDPQAGGRRRSLPDLPGHRHRRQRRRAKVSQRQEGAAAVRRHRRLEVHRSRRTSPGRWATTRTISSRAASTASTF